jgi:hypothetical protein
MRDDFQRPSASRHDEVFRLKGRPGKAPALDDVDPQDDGRASFDRRSGQFAVSPRGVAIAKPEQVALDVDRKVRITPNANNLPRCRKADHYVLLEGKRKYPPAAQKDPEWHQCRCYHVVTALRRITSVKGYHSGVIGCARTLSLCKR